MKLKRLYADIAKTEKQDDGTIKVWGYASSGSKDSDGETITPEAMKAALPDYMKFGAVREMHQPSAAGTAIEAEVQDDGRTWFGAHVVDPVAVKKVETGVYKGFSIGGKVTKRDELNKTNITGLNLFEVSLVDRPANPDAVFTVFKAEATPQDAVDELAAMLDSGAISPQELVALAKAHKEGVAAPAAAPAPAEEVKKGMGHVASLAWTLKEILWLVQDQMNEAEREGDGSDVPAKLKDWLAAGGEILKDMVTEEVAELVGSDVDDDPDTIVISLAARAVGLVKGETVEKAGAALSAKNKGHIDVIHKACVALGACGSMDKAAHADELTKAAKAHDDTLAAIAKAAGAAEGANVTEAVESLAKRAKDAEESLTKAQARVQELEAMPAPGKALLKAIGKTADNVTGEEGGEPVVDPVKKGDGTVDNAATLIKAIHAGARAGLSNS